MRVVTALAVCVPVLAGGQARAAPKVVASIKPVHSLVAGVMAGVAEPELLVEGGRSPHTYSLRPSQARALSDADVVVWIGPGLETFLAKALTALAGEALVLELAKAPGISLLPAREGGIWQAHAHQEPDEDPHAGPAHGRYNLHIWLDPENARHIVTAVASALSEEDPANAGHYRANAEGIRARLSALDQEVAAILGPVQKVPFVVFHDAYQYVEARYDLGALGSITISPDRSPSARRLYEIRTKIRGADAACVFTEPAFEPALVETVVEGTRAKTGVLDPLGADLAAGPDAYFRLMQNLAGSLRTCLEAAG